MYLSCLGHESYVRCRPILFVLIHYQISSGFCIRYPFVTTFISTDEIMKWVPVNSTFIIAYFRWSPVPSQSICKGMSTKLCHWNVVKLTELHHIIFWLHSLIFIFYKDHFQCVMGHSYLISIFLIHVDNYTMPMPRICDRYLMLLRRTIHTSKH